VENRRKDESKRASRKLIPIAGNQSEVVCFKKNKTK
jgi:hypothetical protein